MSWTRDDPEELGDGVEEVEDLRDEEEQQGLAEVPEDANHSKRHARKVAVRVPHKHRRGIPRAGQGRGRGQGVEEWQTRGLTDYQ